MSTYTTTIWEVIKSLNNYEADDPAILIEKYRNKIFNFNYATPTTFDESEYKKWFETMFIMHFGSWEIGCDTLGLFLLRLQSKCLEVMPSYAKIFDNLNAIQAKDFKHGQYGTVKRDNESSGTNDGNTDSMASTLPINMISSNAISDVKYADSSSKVESSNKNTNKFKENATYDLTYFVDIIGLVNYNEQANKAYKQLLEEFNILFLGVM